MLCVFLNKSLLERFFSIILLTSLVFSWNLGLVEELQYLCVIDFASTHLRCISWYQSLG